MSYLYRAARAHQEELLRGAQRSQSEDGVQAPAERSLLKSTHTLYLRLTSDLQRKSAEDAATTA
jgi:hypothetical protein